MPIDISALSEAVLWAVTFLGAFLAALWLSLVIWTFRDMRARSRDMLAQILMAVVVALLTIPGRRVHHRLCVNLTQAGCTPEHARGQSESLLTWTQAAPT